MVDARPQRLKQGFTFIIGLGAFIDVFALGCDGWIWSVSGLALATSVTTDFIDALSASTECRVSGTFVNIGTEAIGVLRISCYAPETLETAR